MNHRDLAEYLDHDHFLEYSEPPPTRAAATERDRHRREVLRLVLEIFPGARWTTRDAYRRAAATRDRKGRRRRGRVPGQR
jgi:hypothetical protein